MIKFFLLSNKQGQIRLSHYYDFIPFDQRPAMEAEIVRKCISRNASQCSFVEYKDYKLVYRRYSSLYFIVGVDSSENELSILELIHNYVEILDASFEQVCELDIMFHLEKAHFILDEMISNGHILEISRFHILESVNLMSIADQKS
ncbi:adapter-related protein complex 4 sigma 1 subunit [Cavenderia fasciculata]|uniref:AP complex subunit sigma n=1 Tax=Cavenderia fasciculata TaxID=261658 RepID=F4Q449_CACFS|nr:adapter-related protein complex 4 sigma 1 subunit [Cavenderia fasciculata]EGG17751.1 adapter-related protein complex 4 sigma 1 subunit [Cavenderia fasciculata]|eukprot:XP_004356235.1 adapter-related protein complex 4 sigma 1 subunit [Cavenderia fasciculata]